jgi:hypothetical protein
VEIPTEERRKKAVMFQILSSNKSLLHLIKFLNWLKSCSTTILFILKIIILDMRKIPSPEDSLGWVNCSGQISYMAGKALKKETLSARERLNNLSSFYFK